MCRAARQLKRGFRVGRRSMEQRLELSAPAPTHCSAAAATVTMLWLAPQYTPFSPTPRLDIHALSQRHQGHKDSTADAHHRPQRLLWVRRGQRSLARVLPLLPSCRTTAAAAFAGCPRHSARRLAATRFRQQQPRGRPMPRLQQPRARRRLQRPEARRQRRPRCGRPWQAARTKRPAPSCPNARALRRNGRRQRRQQRPAQPPSPPRLLPRRPCGRQ